MPQPHALNAVAQQMIDHLALKICEAIDGWPSSDPRDRPAILAGVVARLQQAQNEYSWTPPA